MTTKADDPKYIIRLPGKLRARLQKEAKASRQSLNAYLLTLIETHPKRKP